MPSFASKGFAIFARPYYKCKKGCPVPKLSGYIVGSWNNKQLSCPTWSISPVSSQKEMFLVSRPTDLLRLTYGFATVRKYEAREMQTVLA